MLQRIPLAINVLLHLRQVGAAVCNRCSMSVVIDGLSALGETNGSLEIVVHFHFSVKH